MPFLPPLTIPPPPLSPHDPGRSRRQSAPLRGPTGSPRSALPIPPRCSKSSPLPRLASPSASNRHQRSTAAGRPSCSPSLLAPNHRRPCLMRAAVSSARHRGGDRRHILDGRPPPAMAPTTSSLLRVGVLPCLTGLLAFQHRHPPARIASAPTSAPLCSASSCAPVARWPWAFAAPVGCHRRATGHCIPCSSAATVPLLLSCAAATAVLLATEKKKKLGEEKEDGGKLFPKADLQPRCHRQRFRVFASRDEAPCA